MEPHEEASRISLALAPAKAPLPESGPGKQAHLRRIRATPPKTTLTKKACGCSKDTGNRINPYLSPWLNKLSSTHRRIEMKTFYGFLVASMAFIAPSLPTHALAETGDSDAELSKDRDTDTELTRLGGIDLDRYCRAIAPYGAYSAPVLTGRGGADDWNCQIVIPGDFTDSTPKAVYYVPIHKPGMDQACQMQYGPGAWADTCAPRDPRSWVCWQW